MAVNELFEYQFESHTTIRNAINSYLIYQILSSHYIVSCEILSHTASRPLNSSTRCFHPSPHPTIVLRNLDKVLNHQQTLFQLTGQYGSSVSWVLTRYQPIGVEYNLRHRPIQPRYPRQYPQHLHPTIQPQLYHHLLPCLVMRGTPKNSPISLHPGCDYSSFKWLYRLFTRGQPNLVHRPQRHQWVS